MMKDLLDHTLEMVRLTPADKTLRYAALLHDISKPETMTVDESGVHFLRHETVGADRARGILARLRQPADLIRRVTALIRHHLRIPYYRSEWTDGAVRRLMFDLGDQLEAALVLAQADVAASDPYDQEQFEALLQELRSRTQEIGEAAEIARMKPLLTGDEVMAMLGLEPGPRVGEVLDFLLDEQIEDRITTREEAEAAVRERFGGGRD
jgi:poly(A) polymerase